MLVTGDNYPNILRAFHDIESDNRGFQAMCFPVYPVPEHWDPYLPQIEKALSELSRTERAPESAPLPSHVKPNVDLDCEFSTFTTGEDTEMQAMSNRSMVMTLASVLLMDFFEEFHEKRDPYQRALEQRIEFYDSEGEKEAAQELRMQLK